MFDFDSSPEEIRNSTCGNKFATLHLLNRIDGLGIPPAICLTDKKADAAGFKQWLQQRVAVAVRSSASIEDHKSGSAAGIFESFLNLQNLTDIQSAIANCIAYRKKSRTRSWCRRHGIAVDSVEMAVIIQEYIPAKIAGTAFTANPLNGIPELIIEKRDVDPNLPGLGIQNSEMVSVDKTVEFAPEWLQPLCTAIHKIEKVLDGPLDIEWLWHQDKLYIVQARPLIIKSADQEILEHLWTRGQIGEILPHPLTPLSLDIYSRIDLGASRRRYYSLLDRAGKQMERFPEGKSNTKRRLKVFDGYVYQNIKSLLFRFMEQPWTTPDNLETGLGFKLPEGVDHRHLSSIERLRRRGKTILYLLELIMPGISLEKRVDGIVDTQLRRLKSKHKMHPLKREIMICRFLLGWQHAVAGRILSHLGLIDRFSNWSSEGSASIGPAIQTIAQMRSDPCFRELDQLKTLWQRFYTDRGSASIGKGTQELQQNFYSGYRSFLEKFGHRSVNELELSQTSWSEDDRTLIDLLDTRLAEVEDNITLPYHLSLPLKRVLKRLESAVTARSRIKSIFVRHYRNIRQYYLQQAKILKAQGKIVEQDDIFFLRYEEIEEVINLGPRELRLLLEERREQHHRALTQMPPFYRYHGVGEEVETASQKSKEILSGIGCSAGTRTGRALVVTGFSQDIAVSPEEIIVATSADPGWTPLLMNAGGMITEVGGMLSHIATIARESHIPFVVNVTGGMKKIRNGQLITIDGYNGRVILEEEVAAARS